MYTFHLISFDLGIGTPVRQRLIHVRLKQNTIFNDITQSDILYARWMQVQAFIIQYNIITDGANIFVCSLINISWYADRPVPFHCLSIHAMLVDKR